MKNWILPILIIILIFAYIIFVLSTPNFTIINKGEKKYPNQKWCICDTLGNVIKK